MGTQGATTTGSSPPFPPSLLDGMLACPDCDRLARAPRLQPHQFARCRYCGAMLRHGQGTSIQNIIALSLASLVLFAVANMFPFVSLKSGGLEQEIHLSTGLFALVESGVPLPGVVAIAFVLLTPILRLVGFLYVLVPLRLRIEPPSWRPVLRVANNLQPWSMLEIYLLSVVVALVKISELGSIALGVSFWCFVLMVITSTWLSSITDRFQLWELVESWLQS